MKKITRKRIEDILRAHRQELKKRFKLKEIGIFGSFVRDEQKKRSDIDILVEFEKAPGLLKFIETEEYLSKILELKVDLVMKKALKPGIGKYILKEVVYI
jgi:hypothetical protein